MHQPTDASGGTVEGAEDGAAESAGPTRRSISPWLRVGILVLLLVGAGYAVHATGLCPEELLERLQTWMVGAGPWGVLLFVVAFAIGELAHVPGLVFVAAAALAYGRLWGGVVGYLGALTSVIVSFWVVRAVGGQMLAQISHPRVRRILDRLESQPIRVIVILRLVLWMAPPLNYALAMSGVRFRQYAIGSAIGLALPVFLATAFADVAVDFFLR